MSIIVVDNFQVNLSNPIDNRFVVGSQSITSVPPGLYPTPFYAYKEDIIYKYPGLRIWDFNVNIPYFWNGTQWINENTTGAVVENAATGNTGFKNYLTKFKDDTTLLTSSLVYDTGSNIGIGLTGVSITPGGVGSKGLHVLGNIRTNAGFVGIGTDITQINATNITSGSLNLVRITPPPFTPPSPTIPYILKNVNGSNTGTSWDLLSNIVPVSARNLTVTSIPNSTFGYVYGGVVASEYTFKPILSTGLQITDNNNNDIRIESKAGINLGAADNPTSADGIAIYAGLDANNIHQFKRIKSSSLEVELDGANSIKIEVPATFEGTDYYVNIGYDQASEGLEQLGTRSKPFKELTTCLNKILNRPTVGVTPATNNSANDGNPWLKWNNRGGEQVRVIIQSYSEARENLAINGVTYILEGSSSQIWITKDINIEYLIDMKELTDNVVRTTDGKLPYKIETKIEGYGTIGFAGYYGVQSDWHPYRKGFFRASGTNAFDYTTTQGGTITPWGDEPDCYLYVGSEGGTLSLLMARLPALTYDPITAEDNITPISREGINQNGYKTTNQSTPDYGCIQVEGRNAQFWESLELKGTLIIHAQEQHQIYQKNWGTSYSDNGRIYLRRNYQQVLYDSIEYKIQGNRNVDALEVGRWYRVTFIGTTTLTDWKLIADTSSGWRDAIGGEIIPTNNVTLLNIVGLVFKRNSTSVPSIGNGRVGLCDKRYLPSKNVYDIYLKDGAGMNYGGDFYTQQNTAATQGGPDSFLCLEVSGQPTQPQIDDGANADFRINKSCFFAANGGGFVTNLLYNSYIKSIVHSDYNDYAGNGVSFKNLKLESTIYNYVINIITQTGATWGKFSRDIGFKDSFLADYYGEIKLPFSNIPKNKLSIVGTTINQPGGYFNNRLPYFENSTAGLLAATSSLWPGMFYRIPDGVGGFTVKVVG
jgi:hypothetical protein